MLKTPIFITNFKNYENSTGIKAVELAKIHEKVANDTNCNIAISPSNFDLYRVSQEVSISVLAQHIDPIDYGKGTGHLVPSVARQTGVIGTLLNHSERRLSIEILKNTLIVSKKSNLMSIVCVETPEEITKVLEFKPDFIAFEPPELIGSKDKSVASEKPTSIADAVQKSKGVPILVGAGVNSALDIEVSLKLGAKGFLVATAIIQANNPEQKLRELISMF